jgi:hypothetical protein
MAIKDLRSTVSDLLAPQETVNPTEEQIQRVFAELSTEMGMNNADMLYPDPAEEFKLVYDKFSAKTR